MLYLLDEMSNDGGLVVGFNVFIPFTDEEMNTFFLLCDRAHVAQREMERVRALKPCPQVLTLSERKSDTAALFQRWDDAALAVDAVQGEILAFRQRVLERFKASRK